jgi:hypothetical protein
VECLEFFKHSRFAITLTVVKDKGKKTQKAVHAVGCASHGQEAGLEAIRMALDGEDRMAEGCTDLSTNCKLKWRDGSKRVIIMITDEDSDLPTNR